MTFAGPRVSTDAGHEQRLRPRRAERRGGHRGRCAAGRHRHRAAAASSRWRKACRPARARDRRRRPLRARRAASTRTATSTSRCRRRRGWPTTSTPAPRSAACGGTTTVIPFAAQQRASRCRPRSTTTTAAPTARRMIDYAFHLIVTDPTPDGAERGTAGADRRGLHVVQDLHDLRRPEARRRPDPGRARRSRARHGAMAMVHAENADCIAWLTERLEARRATPRRATTRMRGRCWSSARRRTARSRCRELVDVPILIVHVSGREAVEQIRWARARGLTVYAETCPQYLFLTAEDLGIDDGYEGAQVRLQPAAARRGQPGGDLGRPGRRPVHGLLVGPCAVQLRRARRQDAGRPGGAVQPHPERHPGAGDAPAAAVLRRRARRAASPSSSSWS